MTDGFHDRHHTRLMNTVAFVDEFLDPTDDIEEIRAEYDDAHHCKDEALRKRVDAEASKRERAAAKLASCYALLRTAGQQESEELSRSATAELRRVVLDEFRRRTERGAAGDTNP